MTEEMSQCNYTQDLCKCISTSHEKKDLLHDLLQKKEIRDKNSTHPDRLIDSIMFLDLQNKTKTGCSANGNV